MTFTFENDNDVIVYALEMIISYARRTQQIFVAQCVWWLVSIIGLESGLVNYIDNLRSREVSPLPRDIQEDPQLSSPKNFSHPDRVDQINTTNPDISYLDLNVSRPRTPSGVVDSAKQFLLKSKKERKAFNRQKKIDQLSRTRSGKVLMHPLTTGQIKYLQCIPKDTISDYLENRR
jgi:hypothetical protein